MTPAVLFPGQGSQFPGMADPWTTHVAGRSVMDAASEAMGRDVVADCHDERALASTEFVQPALLACDVAAFRVLAAEGLRAGAAAGHSLGEFAALVAAGVLELPAALEIVVVRGRAMQEAGAQRAGTMSALIGADPEEAAALCDEARGDDVLLVANENAPQQSVISGGVGAVERAEALAAERRIRTIRLKVAGAFHSPLMEPAIERLSEAIDRSGFRAPRFPIAANVTGALVDEPEELRALLKRQVVSPVRWHRSMETLVGAGFTSFVEAGPGQVLTKLVQRGFPGVSTAAVGTPEAAVDLARPPAAGEHG